MSARACGTSSDMQIAQDHGIQCRVHQEDSLVYNQASRRPWPVLNPIDLQPHYDRLGTEHRLLLGPHKEADCGECGIATRLVCGRCRGVGYCSKPCQVAGWKQGGHRQTCLGSTWFHPSWGDAVTYPYSSCHAPRLALLFSLAHSWTQGGKAWNQLMEIVADYAAPLLFCRWTTEQFHPLHQTRGLDEVIHATPLVTMQWWGESSYGWLLSSGEVWVYPLPHVAQWHQWSVDSVWKPWAGRLTDGHNMEMKMTTRRIHAGEFIDGTIFENSAKREQRKLLLKHVQDTGQPLGHRMANLNAEGSRDPDACPVQTGLLPFQWRTRPPEFSNWSRLPCILPSILPLPNWDKLVSILLPRTSSSPSSSTSSLAAASDAASSPKCSEKAQEHEYVASERHQNKRYLVVHQPHQTDADGCLNKLQQLLFQCNGSNVDNYTGLDLFAKEYVFHVRHSHPYSVVYSCLSGRWYSWSFSDDGRRELAIELARIQIINRPDQHHARI